MNCDNFRRRLKEAMPHVVLSGGDFPAEQACLIDYHDHELNAKLQDIGKIRGGFPGSLYFKGNELSESDIPVSIVGEAELGIKFETELFKSSEIPSCKVDEIHVHGPYGQGIHVHLSCKDMNYPHVQTELINLIARANRMSREDAGLPVKS